MFSRHVTKHKGAVPLCFITCRGGCGEPPQSRRAGRRTWCWKFWGGNGLGNPFPPQTQYPAAKSRKLREPTTNPQQSHNMLRVCCRFVLALLRQM